MRKGFGYLKGTSEEQYDKYIAKDLYGFLRYNKEHIAEVLSVGYDVSFFFVTCTREQAKEIYIKIIEVIQQPTWTLQQVEEAVRSCNPDFYNADPNDRQTNYLVERIARTELNRILFYAKEQYAIQDGELDKYYKWTGPLDRRTTPMCRFLQTGELTGEDSKGRPYDFEHLRPLLPEWREEGWPLDELKANVRTVHDVFYDAGYLKTPMPSDWQCHINCRHTFRAGSVIPREDREDEVPLEFEGWMQPQEMPESPMSVEMNGAYILGDQTDSEEIFVDEYSEAIRPFGFKRSVHGSIPSYYLPTDESFDNEPIFVFEFGDEFMVGKWVKTFLQESEAGMSEYDMVWMMREESPFSDNEITYIAENWQWLVLVALAHGWAV